MLIDSHCHINFKAFSKDRESVIKRALDHFTYMIMVGTQISTSKKAIEIAENYEKGLYAVIGLHPIQSMDIDVEEEADKFHTRGEEFDVDVYRELAKSKKVVGIGEMGLDYYWITDLKGEELEGEKQKQKRIFKQQFDLAQELNLPIVIHCRNAHEDILECLEEWIGEPEEGKIYGVIHSFTGNYKQALRYVDLGFMIGFNGIFTYSESYDKAAKKVPKDKIIIETDCPYLTPKPLEREARNEPFNVQFVAKRLASVLDLSVQEVQDLTTENTKKLFNLDF